MTRRRYTAESGRVRSTLGRKDYSLAAADGLLAQMRRLQAEDLAAGDTFNADSLAKLIADLSAAVRDARAQQERAAA
jgi:hypothetical protein